MKQLQTITTILILFLFCWAAGATAGDKAVNQAAAAAGTAKLDGKVIKGKVLETMDSSGYTYLHLETEKGKVWVAIPQTKVEVGQEVSCSPGMEMRNFESKTLNRTFDTIIFSSGLGGKGRLASPHGNSPHGSKPTGENPADYSFSAALAEDMGHASPPAAAADAGSAGMMGSGGSASAIVPLADIKVDKAEGENSYTVGECFAKAQELNDKKVRVRGKVMKISRMIMGKNWLHIQDGSGNPMENTHDLVVTTQAEPAKDSIVTVEGTLHAGKDFGAGYRYEVIIEDAEVK